MEEILQELKQIHNDLEEIKNKSTMPKLITAKEISKIYRVGLNKATWICKTYGIHIGRWCIEEENFKKLLQGDELKEEYQ
ncbi:MAG: hypothetical protein LBL91_06115 [Lachnospiraceae bacterium]|nr:hypothetical protein [Lachnospiraceae bacterium]